jgi:predicted naringenin-chalcone synthase
VSFAILGLGTAVPPNRVTQAEAAELARVVCCENEEQAELLPVLYRQSGINARHMVFRHEVVQAVLSGELGEQDCESVFLPQDEDDHHGPTTAQRMQRYREEALPLAREASGKALEESGVNPSRITHLVTVSCTGFSAPGVDVGLMKELGLPPTAQRTHVGFMGCHGAINGLRVAQAFADADPDACILLCAVELCSLHFHYGWDPKKVVANALFADGAGAVVGKRAKDEGGKPSVVRCPLSVAEENGPKQGDNGPRMIDNGHPWHVAATGSCLFADSDFAMTWNIGDHGFDMTLSTKVPNLIGKHLRPWLEGWLDRHGRRLQDIRSWAIHPGGPRILTAVEGPLGLPPGTTEVSREVLSEHGNMSSPTVLFILNRLRLRDAPRPCVALGFGPGLMAEAALFE